MLQKADILAAAGQAGCQGLYRLAPPHSRRDPTPEKPSTRAEWRRFWTRAQHGEARGAWLQPGSVLAGWLPRLVLSLGSAAVSGFCGRGQGLRGASPARRCRPTCWAGGTVRPSDTLAVLGACRGLTCAPVGATRPCTGPPRSLRIPTSSSSSRYARTQRHESRGLCSNSSGARRRLEGVRAAPLPGRVRQRQQEPAPRPQQQQYRGAAEGRWRSSGISENSGGSHWRRPHTSSDTRWPPSFVASPRAALTATLPSLPHCSCTASWCAAPRATSTRRCSSACSCPRRTARRSRSPSSPSSWRARWAGMVGSAGRAWWAVLAGHGGQCWRWCWWSSLHRVAQEQIVQVLDSILHNCERCALRGSFGGPGHQN